MRLASQYRLKAEVAVVPLITTLVKPLEEPKRENKMIKNINQDACMPLDEVIEIVKILWLMSMVKDLSGIVKEILGTCVSVR
ncbi:hypothetical protein RJ639_032323 [Escallonia herrerae]|uniref:Large ribosomal subunit protein uL11 C-terminal domain-containing protein n=1 Tax=Escallonia herrerae TaxID=1293975 RepID=A0AA88WVL2_9ASTE|nr:hypothetical protein RJ639_032323 [Escallonia herrerae]